jgi:hypothetical protein
LEARLAHPVFEPLRRWLDQLDQPLDPSLDSLNRFAEAGGLRVESGHALRFVQPAGGDRGYGDYELRVFETGRVETRPGNRHDLFNALAWLSFPRTKARLNALHAAEIPAEKGRRGRFRDLLTILDEGGAIVACGEADLLGMLREFRWQELFWMQRARVLGAMKIHVLGHAVLEQALEPRPGITCKAIVVAPGGDPDAQAAAWLSGLARDATPKDLAPLPIFGYPGWHPGSAQREFYADQRYFRPSRAAVQG